MLLAALVLSVLPCPVQVETGLELVDGKKVEGVVTRGVPWKAGTSYLEGSGPGNSLDCALEIGPGDFTMQARLTLIDVAKSGALFRLGSGQFVFGGAREPSPLVVRGAMFHAGKNKSTFLPDSQNLVQERRTFDFTVTRGGGRVTFSINRKPVHSATIGQRHVGQFGFTPNRSTMRIHRWSIRANLRGRERATDSEVMKLQPRIDNAIDTGVEWLLQAQNRDGSWSYSEPAYRGGQTGLATYTLLKAGLSPTHPSVARALTFLETVRADRTYSAACQLLAFSATGDVRYRPKMKQILGDLLKWQKRGVFGYPHNRPDLSNTQYAALGFRAAHLAGLKVPVKAWSELMVTTMRFQETARMERPKLPVRTKSGTFAMPAKVATAGFCYVQGGRKATGSMTTAGISILAFCEQALAKRAGKQRANARWAIEKGMRWLANNFTVKTNPGAGRSWHYYYLYGVERVGGALDIPYIGDHHWYLEGARLLVEQQKDDGSWRQRDAEPDTCFAILFLKRATANRPTITGGERRRNDLHASVDPSYEVQLRGTGSQDLAVWVSGFSKDVLARYASAGLRVQRVEYSVDGKKIATVPGNPTEKWAGKTYPTRHAFERRGSYTVASSVFVVSADAPPDATEPLDELTNPGFVVDVRRILVDMEDEPVRENRLSLLAARDRKAEASSEQGKNKAAFAVDGIQSTRWLCKPKDTKPTLTLTLDTALRANAVVLRQPATRSLDVGVFDRIVQVELVINQRDRFSVDMNPKEIEPTVFFLPRETKIRQLEIIVLKRAPGQKRGVTGLAEVALERRRN